MCTPSSLVCTSCTHGVQEKGAVWSTTQPIAEILL